MKTQFLMGLSEKSSNYAYASQELCKKNIVILTFKVRISKKTNEICFCDVCKNFIRKKEVHEITTAQKKKRASRMFPTNYRRNAIGKHEKKRS